MSIITVLNECVANKETRFSYEMLPPLKGAGIQATYDAIDNLMPYNPAFISVTFHRYITKEVIDNNGVRHYHALRRRPGTVGIASAIRQRYGLEVLPHLICSGHSRYDIEDALIDMDFLGLENVLALRGDKEQGTDHFEPHPQGYSYGIDLVRQIREMNNGIFVDGQVEDCYHSRFTIGVAGYPEKHLDASSLDADIKALKAKVDAGADFVITQLFFDNEIFFDFVRRCRAADIDVPIIPGIKPFSTIKHATLLPDTFGVKLPEIFINEILKHADNADAIRQIGKEWCLSQCRELKAAGFPIIHLYTMGKTNDIADMVRQI